MKDQQQISILAKARPAIISNSNGSPALLSSLQTNSCHRNDLNQSANATGMLGEKIHTIPESNHSMQHKENLMRDLESLRATKQRLNHIEDDSVIQKQNASNQMRQAAVMSATVGQQKRLSATERLAMTAKISTNINQSANNQTNHLVHNRSVSMQLTRVKPNTQQQQQPQQQNFLPKPHPTLPQPKINSFCMGVAPKPAPPAPNSKPLPTLETLLAAHRQLKQHTKQNLNSSVLHNDMVTKQNQDLQQQQKQALNGCEPKCERRVPQSEPREEQSCDAISDTYEKELPPLPPSISPSTCTDESQFNSLDSQQSSEPETSLVSIPPPPPPLSAYYDEVNHSNGNGSCQSSESPTPSILSSTVSEQSSIRHYPVLPVKQSSNIQNALKNKSKIEQGNPDQKKATDLSGSVSSRVNTALPTAVQNQSSLKNQLPPAALPPPPLAPRPQHLTAAKTQPQKSQFINTASSEQQAISHQPMQTVKLSPLSCGAVKSNGLQSDQAQAGPKIQQQAYQAPQISVARSMSMFMPPPPPPLMSVTNTTTATDQSISGFDEPDCGSFRFPTPPPLDLLLKGDEDVNQVKPTTGFVSSSGDDDDDDDEDFQCKIPTPPPHKSMSTANFQNFQVGARQLLDQKQHQLHLVFPSNDVQQQEQQRADAVQWTTSPESSPSRIQLPPLFRQSSTAINNNQLKQQQQPQQQQPSLPQVFAKPSNSQLMNLQQQQPTQAHLTVQISQLEHSNVGLLSTANHQAAEQQNHHHHRMMMTMATSSSSPSSSSDGDGHSSNSSSSTSGIHSSIDSPSSSNSKLDDFNYAIEKQTSATQLAPHQQHQVFRNNLCGERKVFSAPSLRKTALQAPPPPPLPPPVSQAINNAKFNQQFASQQQQKQPQQQLHRAAPSPISTPTPSIASNSSVTNSAKLQPAPLAKPTRPALKQKKTVSFSDKVELVACAEEQCIEHLPNPLLARVLAGKMQ